MVAPEQLSRVVSHALRHEPWVYELELDGEGWAPVDGLLTAVREQGPRWSDVDRDALVDMIESSAKRRHEIDGDRIRALYGHSVPGQVLKIEAEPPERLFHGTSPEAWEAIQCDGLRPMARQYVHLSADVSTAEQVGRRKASAPVILVVQARRAHEAGSRFWQGNDLVWLADHVPAICLSTD
ncbi:RNA 2'-phosphotransferase [Pseudonocardia spinosispora]|uniref:RNA 2'-phosphotransferase n=1 Tax=Pseudonocardia spinosispora TaxID=103441 RepID=UPI00040435E9|nr:RNA 2'-phosphotransferase [Pseudonocardia spinosispora]